MKTRKKVVLQILFFLSFSFVFSACSDSNENTGPNQVDPLVTLWNVTNFVMTDAANPATQVDLFTTISGFNGTIEFKEDGRYEVKFFMNSTLFDQENGTFTATSNSINIMPDNEQDTTTLTYTFSNNNNTLQLRDENSEFDFDGDAVDDPAIAEITMTRQL